jgi:hypothetical protein
VHRSLTQVLQWVRCMKRTETFAQYPDSINP